jgi:CheY-like chemotaxis protein
VLEDAANEVVSFSGEGSVVSELASAAPDAVILGLLFRGPSSQLSGWDHVRLIRTHEALRRVPILVCSRDAIGLGDRGEEIERDPLLSSVTKPFTLPELEDAVLRMIGAQRVPEWGEERDLILVADADARLVHASAAMRAMLELDLEALKACRVEDIVAEGPAWTEREWQRYPAERTWEGPVVLRTRSGAVVPASARAEIINGPSSTWHISRIHVAF